MSFVLKTGAVGNGRPLPAYGDVGGSRWEYRCGWCDELFRTPGALVAHVAREREAAA